MARRTARPRLRRLPGAQAPSIARGPGRLSQDPCRPGCRERHPDRRATIRPWCSLPIGRRCGLDPSRDGRRARCVGLSRHRHVDRPGCGWGPCWSSWPSWCSPSLPCPVWAPVRARPRPPRDRTTTPPPSSAHPRVSPSNHPLPTPPIQPRRDRRPLVSRTPDPSRRSGGGSTGHSSRWRRRSGAPGMVAAVKLPDGSVWYGSDGVLWPGGPKASSHTPFAWGSITKTFVAALTLRAASQGQLSLDQTIDSWLPQVAHADEITVRMLLAHRSGIFDYFQHKDYDKLVFDHPDHVWTPERDPRAHRSPAVPAGQGLQLLQHQLRAPGADPGTGERTAARDAHP